MGDAGGCEGVVPEEGLVAGAVVGQDSFDGDVVAFEEGVCAGPEGGGRLLALVGKDFAVGEAGVVVDCGVDVAVADDRVAASSFGGGGLSVACSCRAPDGAPASAVGDVALMSTWTNSPGCSRS